jgi:hypothetical protein
MQPQCVLYVETYLYEPLPIRATKHVLHAPHVTCRALFGYRMEMVSDPWADVAHAPTTYTLTSCFGPKEDVLMFRCANCYEPVSKSE